MSEEAKCTCCGKGFPFTDLHCMLSVRGANSNCKDHQQYLVCDKCGGFDKKDHLKCPCCKSMHVSWPNRMSIGGTSMVVRQCYDCLAMFNPNGTEIPRETQK